MPSAIKRKRDQSDSGAGAKQPTASVFAHGTAYDPDFLPGAGELELAEALKQHNAVDTPESDSNDTNGQTASDTATAALHLSIPGNGNQEDTFMDETPEEGAPSAPDTTFDNVSPNDTAAPTAAAQYTVEQPKMTSAPLAPTSTSPTEAPLQQQSRQQQQQQQQQQPASSSSPPSSPGKSDPKLKVGSDEWAALRRNNHKEVERRRRETINDGITELGKIVPGAERNKGSILHRAVQYITDLTDRQKEMETKNNLEKMMFEQAIAEMSASGDKLKGEVRRLEEEVARLRAKAGERA